MSAKNNEIAALTGQIHNLNAVLAEAQKRVAEFDSAFSATSAQVGHNYTRASELFTLVGRRQEAADVAERLPAEISKLESRLSELQQ